MIHDITPVNTYSGNNSATHFDFDFYVESENQLNVIYYNSEGETTTLTNNVDYTINELRNPNGSYITFPIQGSSYSVLSSDEKISLELTLPIAQETQYNNSSLLNLQTLEYSFDYLTRICQIMNRQTQRAIKVAEGSNISTDVLAFDLEKVANIADDVSTVAGISGDVTSVKNNATNISTVSGSINNVNATGNSIANVNAIAGDLTNIDTVASDLTNIDAVASDLTNIDAASTNAQLSKDWATKTDGAVDGSEYSAKYYAQQAAQGQIQANWNETDTSSNAYIQNKPVALSAFTDDLGSSPTHTHSQYELISKPIDTLSSSGTIALEDNTERSITPTGNVTFTLPTVTDNTVTHKIVVQLNLSTVYTIDLGLGNTPHYFHKTAPDLSNTGVYDLIYIYDKANQYWACGAIEKGVVS